MLPPTGRRTRRMVSLRWMRKTTTRWTRKMRKTTEKVMRRTKRMTKTRRREGQSEQRTRMTRTTKRTTWKQRSRKLMTTIDAYRPRPHPAEPLPVSSPLTSAYTCPRWRLEEKKE